MEASDTVVFAYGRFNPPTTGHEKLIEKVVSVAGTNDYRIYPSHTQNAKKDPLPQTLKIAYMRKMFKKYARNIIATKSKNAIEIAVELYDQGYKNLIMIAGSDRVKVFDTMLNQYNGVEGKRHGYYKFDSIEIVSAGERDPDSEGVEGMSASKMRDAATDGDFDSFSKGLPSGFGDSKKLYRDVRKYMGIREEKEMGDMTDFEFMRDAYLTGKIWNVGDIVEANGVVGEVVRKGTNYLSFMAEDGKVHKAWLHEIELDEDVKDLPPHLQKLIKQLEKKEKELEKKGLKVKTFVYNPDTGKPDIEINERNYAKEYQNYQGTPEQIARRSSRNKARRVMGDKTKIGMDVGHKDNDPLNNDPKNLRNEVPSDNRREPRLRGKIEIDEKWWKDLVTKISQIRHPKGWDEVIKQYVDGMNDPEHRKHPTAWADEIAKGYSVRGLDGRQLVKYINALILKGKLPKELEAGYTREDWSFRDFVSQIQDVHERELTDTELKRREEIAQDLSDDDFKKRYGDRWKEVKMGVATKMAKKESLKT